MEGNFLRTDMDGCRFSRKLHQNFVSDGIIQYHNVNCHPKSQVFTAQSSHNIPRLSSPILVVLHFSSATSTNVTNPIFNFYHGNLLPLPSNLPNSTPIPLLPSADRPLLRCSQNNTAPKKLNPASDIESDVQRREGDGFRFREGQDPGSTGRGTEAWEGFGEERRVEWVVGQR